MTTQNVIKKPVAPITTTRRGIITALIAFFIWGGFPLYFKQLSDYDATEIIGHRIIGHLCAIDCVSGLPNAGDG